MHLLVFFLPCLIFLIIGRPFAAFFALLLQITMIGWIPAAIWATFALVRHNDEKRYARMYYQQHYRNCQGMPRHG